MSHRLLKSPNPLTLTKRYWPHEKKKIDLVLCLTSCRERCDSPPTRKRRGQIRFRHRASSPSSTKDSTCQGVSRALLDNHWKHDDVLKRTTVPWTVDIHFKIYGAGCPLYSLTHVRKRYSPGAAQRRKTVAQSHSRLFRAAWLQY